MARETLDKRLKKAAAFLKKQEDISAAYLFGSTAQNTQGPLSDIDIAVHFDESVNRKEMSQKKLFLIGALVSLLKTDRLDLVVMNEAGLLMNYNIIRYGKVLKSSPQRVQMETSIMSRYLDRRYYDQRYDQIFIKRVAERGLR